MNEKEKLKVIKDMKKLVKKSKCIMCGEKAEALLGFAKKKKGKITKGSLALCNECINALTETLIKRLMIQSVEEGKLEEFADSIGDIKDCGDENCPIHGKKGEKGGRKKVSEKDIMYN